MLYMYSFEPNFNSFYLAGRHSNAKSCHAKVQPLYNFRVCFDSFFFVLWPAYAALKVGQRNFANGFKWFVFSFSFRGLKSLSSVSSKIIYLTCANKKHWRWYGKYFFSLFLDRVDFKQEIPLFKLKTLSGNKVQGYWYKESLKSVDKDNLTNRKIIKQRFEKGKTQVLIQKGKHNSEWIDIDELFIPKKWHQKSGSIVWWRYSFQFKMVLKSPIKKYALSQV